MKNGKCNKCGAEDIVRIPGRSSFAAGDNSIPSGGFTKFSNIAVTRYLCVECGFSEEWIDEREGIQKLKKKYGTS